MQIFIYIANLCLLLSSIRKGIFDFQPVGWSVGRSVSLKIGSRGLSEVTLLFLMRKPLSIVSMISALVLVVEKSERHCLDQMERWDVWCIIWIFRKEQFFDICIFCLFLTRNLPWEISFHTILKVIEGWSIANVHNCPSLTIGIRKHGTNDAMMKPLVSLIKSECLEKSR